MKLIKTSEYEDYQLAIKEMPRLREIDRIEIDLQNREERLSHNEKMMKENFELQEKKAVAALEDKLAKEINDLKAKHQRALMDVERKASEKFNTQLEKLTKENYEKLSGSMTKLHEEGNQQTKFVQSIAEKMIGTLGTSLPMNSQKLQIEETKTVINKDK